jgi:hypothetical protein
VEAWFIHPKFYKNSKMQLNKKRIGDVIYGDPEQAPSMLTVSPHMLIHPLAPSVLPLEAVDEDPMIGIPWIVPPPVADVVDPFGESPEVLMDLSVDVPVVVDLAHTLLV